MSGALILAAGFSRRFGADKRQHLLSMTGQTPAPMLCVTARRYLEVFDATVVVVRPEDESLIELLRHELPDVTVTTAAAARLGMGHSLAAGITAVRNWQYTFVGLGDMPWVRSSTLRTLRTTMESAIGSFPDGLIVQPRCHGRMGHPVGFSSQFYPALMALEGDAGARRVVRQAGAAVHMVDVDDEGVLQDLDQPD